MASPPPKFEIGQSVAVYCPPKDHQIIPVTTVIDRGFISADTIIYLNGNGPFRVTNPFWGYKVSEDPDSWFHEICLRPLGPGEYESEGELEELEQC